MTSPPPPNQIYQHSLLTALMHGLASSSSSIPASSLSAYNMGLGTFEHMDGELVLLDGTVYQLLSNGTVRTASASDPIPFATAVNLQPTAKFTADLPNKDVLHAKLGETFPGCDNLFVAYRIEAPIWTRVKVRAMSKQQYPGQPLPELWPTQKVYEYENIKGTVVGFRTPENWQGINVAGEHLHFISEDRKLGGHVLEVEVQGAEVGAAEIDEVRVGLPRSEEFNKTRLAVDDSGIKKVEG